MTRLAVIIAQRSPDKRAVASVKRVAKQLGPDDELVVALAGDGPDEAVKGLRSVALPVWPVVLPVWTSRAAALNHAAAKSDAEVLVLLEAGASPEPGWLEEMWALSREGDVVAGGIETPPGRRSARPHDPGDLDGENGFLPWGSGANLAVRRRVFEELGGLDESLVLGHDRDLCFRAQLAGHRLVAAPRARVRLRRSNRSGREDIRRLLREGEAEMQLRHKYNGFAFHAAVERAQPAILANRHAWGERLALGAERLLLDPRRATSARPMHGPPGPLTCALRGASLATARLRMLTGNPPAPSRLAPASADAFGAARASRSPALLLVSADARALGLVRHIVRAAGISAPPEALAAEVTELWDDPAPWSMRLVRMARSQGWEVDQSLASRRLEQLRPRSWGEAYLHLHSIEAWLNARYAAAVSGCGPSARALADRLSDVPLVTVGNSVVPRRASLGLQARDLLWRPRHVRDSILELLQLPNGEHEARWSR